MVFFSFFYFVVLLLCHFISVTTSKTQDHVTYNNCDDLNYTNTSALLYSYYNSYSSINLFRF